MHAPPPDLPLVRLRGVSKFYEEAGQPKTVLRDASFDIAAGEIVAILGRSGSGKSTLLNLIAGIDAASAGSVQVAGLALESMNDRTRTLFRRRHIGFVYQFFNLIPTLTVLENVRLPLELNGRDRADERALEMLGRVGLDPRQDAFPDQLSGGEQQRVAIARALVDRPRLILADEPTGNLDAETGEQVLEILRGMAREEGRSLIVVTHSRRVAAIADRVLRVERQAVVEEPAGGGDEARKEVRSESQSEVQGESRTEVRKVQTGSSPDRDEGSSPIRSPESA